MMLQAADLGLGTTYVGMFILRVDLSRPSRRWRVWR